jgi:hypothetical protein
MVKRCFICGAKQDDEGDCTNSNCPRSAATLAKKENGAEKTETAATK